MNPCSRCSPIGEPALLLSPRTSPPTSSPTASTSERAASAPPTRLSDWMFVDRISRSERSPSMPMTVDPGVPGLEQRRDHRVGVGEGDHDRVRLLADQGADDSPTAWPRRTSGHPGRRTRCPAPRHGSWRRTPRCCRTGCRSGRARRRSTCPRARRRSRTVSPAGWWCPPSCRPAPPSRRWLPPWCRRVATVVPAHAVLAMLKAPTEARPNVSSGPRDRTDMGGSSCTDGW